MKLIEALEILQQNAPVGAPPLEMALACGFTPLYLATFVKAALQVSFPDRLVELTTGLYGDLAGNLERLESRSVTAVAVALEWPDFDPRLGIRHLGGWGPSQLQDILTTAQRQSLRLQQALEVLSRRTTVVALSLPTLPLPPASFAPGQQAAPFDLELRECANSLGAGASKLSGVRVLNQQRLDRVSPPFARFDVKSEISMGFPYTLAHASAVAELLACLIRNPQPKKGLITDLDNTLWSGILGEVGIEGISWDLEHHSHMHGLYQQVLRAMAEEGVLIAVASRNDPALVRQAFERAHPILTSEHAFPIEAHWGPKSGLVNRILQTWNVGAESVVFVDDSAMDVAEVQAAYPDLESVVFPVQADEAIYRLLEDLRDRFGRQEISDEDRVRLKSIRSAVLAGQEAAKASNADAFLQGAEAVLSLIRLQQPPDRRALELVNKTNQFNLNGRRYTESEWRECLEGDNVFALLGSFADRYGPLGKIAVLKGICEGQNLLVDAWVMSCRAFSRRIEHQILAQVFEIFSVEEIEFDFVPTPRNGPLRDFFAEFLGSIPHSRFRLGKTIFAEKCPPLYHQVQLNFVGGVNGTFQIQSRAQ